MPDIMPQQRQQAAALVTAFIDAHKDEIRAGIDLGFLPCLREGEELPDWKLGLELAGRMIEDKLVPLLAVDQAKTEELEGDYQPHEELQEASREVQSQLVFLRRLLTGLYGAEIANEILAIAGPTAHVSQAALLERQGAHVVQRFREIDLESFEPFSEAFEINALALAHDLELAVTWLAQARQDVERQRHWLHTILKEKARCLEELDAAYRAVVSFVKGLCQMAGRPDLACEIKADWLRGVS